MILGAGGHGQTVADAARQLGKYDEISFLDDYVEAAKGKCAEYLQFADDTTEMYPAFGHNENRLAWEKTLQEAGIPLARIIHPLAYVSPTAVISDGSVILPYAIVNTNCVVKQGCIVNCGAIVDHGCILEEGVHVGLGAIVKAENRVPKYRKVEAGEVISIHTYPL